MRVIPKLKEITEKYGYRFEEITINHDSGWGIFIGENLKYLLYKNYDFVFVTDNQTINYNKVPPIVAIHDSGDGHELDEILKSLGDTRLTCVHCGASYGGSECSICLRRFEALPPVSKMTSSDRKREINWWNNNGYTIESKKVLARLKEVVDAGK